MKTVSSIPKTMEKQVRNNMWIQGVRMKKQKKEKTKGFTLVELIVVLLILAILAAMLVPALLGYIDRAKESEDLVIARTMLEATQAELGALYAANKGMTADDFNAIMDEAIKIQPVSN